MRASVDVTKLEMTDWKKVAVVVASDGYLHAQKVGTTAFNNSSAEWRPQDIDVDARIAAAIAPVLRSFPIGKWSPS
jgi:flagellar motor protein MotB